MKHTSTGLFMVFYAVLFITVTGILGLLTGVFFANSLPLNNNALLIALGTILAFAGFMIVSFGLRSYYYLPASLIKITIIYALILLVLNIGGYFFDTSAPQSILDMSVNMAFNSISFYVSLFLADKYFSKRSQ